MITSLFVSFRLFFSIAHSRSNGNKKAVGISKCAQAPIEHVAMVQFKIRGSDWSHLPFSYFAGRFSVQRIFFHDPPDRIRKN